jgi:hypothetical protein
LNAFDALIDLSPETREVEESLKKGRFINTLSTIIDWIFDSTFVTYQPPNHHYSTSTEGNSVSLLSSVFNVLTGNIIAAADAQANCVLDTSYMGCMIHCFTDKAEVRKCLIIC